MTRHTLYPYVNILLDELLAQLRAVLAEKLVGLYLYGSLVTGDFEPRISDIDLLAALRADLQPPEFAALDALHTAFVARHPSWSERIEIAYLSVEGLTTFTTRASPIGIISPGEPLHIIPAGREWLVNWYIVCEYGLTLYGPPAAGLITPVSKDEFIAVIKDHVRLWRSGIHKLNDRPGQSDAILTMCRALYTVEQGQHPSKVQAAAWTAQQFPQWAPLIRAALQWRLDPGATGVNHAATFPDTLRFVNTLADRILGEG